MERSLLNKSSIQNALTNFVVIKADVTRLGAPEKALLQSFDVVAPPTFIFLDSKGNERKGHRLVGEQTEETFSKHLDELVE